MLTYPFTEQDAQKAYDDWGANCGPNALAFAMGLHIDKVKGLIRGFDSRGYTSPTMMRQALNDLGTRYISVNVLKPEPPHYADIESMFDERAALVRIQWEGPWTEPGANPKWAYRQTHWVATWLNDNTAFVFDVNGGVRTLESWEKEIVPLLVEHTPRATGGWFPTHIWRIVR